MLLDLSDLLIGILLISIAIIATLVILYFLGNRWKKDAAGELKQLLPDIRSYRTQTSKLSFTLSEYDEIEQEPFISRVAEFQDQINTLNTQTADLEGDYTAIQDQIRSASTNPWKSILGAPFFWRSTRRDITALKSHLGTLGAFLQSTQKSEAALKQLGWEVALKAREARGVDQQVKLLLGQLRSKNVHGDMFDNAVLREERARNSLNEIPEFFLTADEETVLAQAEEDSITKTYRILGDIKPELDNLLKQVQTWVRQYNEAVKIITRMRRVLGSVEGSAAGVPGTIDMEEFNDRLDGLNIISQNLHATLSRLEIESIPVVIEEARRVQVNAQEMDADLKKARQQVSSLESVLTELNEGMKRLSDQFGALGTSKVLPVVWDESKPALTELSRQVNTIQPAGVQRTIEQVILDFSTAAKLNDQRKELAAHCQEIADQHIELSKLLNSPEIRHSRDWLAEARLVNERANTYSPDNWPRSDAVITLDDDLQILDGNLEQLVFINPGEPLPEEALPQRLEKTRQLIQSYQALRVRINNIQKRLAQIQDIESDTREELKVVEADLTQISFVVGSNAYLNKVASRDLERYEDHLGRLINELNTRERDTIEKKARKVELLASKIDGSTSKWLNQLTKESDDQTVALSTSITTLKGIAVIDEKPIYDARQLLSSKNMYSSPVSKSAATGELIQALKTRSDFWQESSAVSQAVEDIESPVAESYARASQNRQRALDEYADLTNWMRQTRDWPPTTVSLESEKLELKSLDTQWKAGKGATTKAITLVQKLGELGGRYRMLGDRIHLAGERVSEEQQGVEELEIQLDEYMQSWQDQWRSHRSSPLASQEIDELLSDADRELKEIKNDYKGGKKGYDDVVQALKLLHRRVRLAQIAVDDNHVIDIDGRAIAYRG